MAENKVILELIGRLVGDGYTLPIATSTRLGVIRVGDGLTIDPDGILSVIPVPIATPETLGVIKVGESLSIDKDGVLNIVPIEHNAFSKLSIKHNDGQINKSAVIREDIIELDLKKALKVENINGVPTISLNFGSYLDDDKPMTGADIKEYVNSIVSGFDVGFGGLEEWLANLYLCTNTYIATQTYEVTTDSSGLAALPFNSEDTQANYVFINGLLAIEEKDYQITDNNIQLVQSEFVSGEDVVTFVVLESVIDGKTGESKPIDVSSEIYEIKTDTDGYAQLPFTYDDKVCQVFINGVFAIKGKDYSIDIDSNSIQIEKSEFITGEDAVTFVVLQALNEDVADSKSIDITLDIYETETNKSGCAAMPLVPKIMINNYGDEAVQIYINGMYAIANKDYYIEDGNIQLINTELGANDVITFIVFKSEMKNSSDETYTNLIPITEEELDNICK